MDQAALLAMFSQFKKGMYTSEFWLVAASVVWTAARTAYDPGRPFSEQAINIALIAGSALYAASRSYLKGKRVVATAIVSTGQAAAQTSQVLQVDEVPAEATDTTTPPTTTP